MKIELPIREQRFLSKLVKEGRYKTQVAVVRDSLQLLRNKLSEEQTALSFDQLAAIYDAESDQERESEATAATASSRKAETF
ncbi:MAG: hypothetical protein L0Z50_06870 [Verrucomicrobiales bacterium]|nr:hypothetical protein [Verrucomicrobiales bacterium]